jgi:leucyl aminopeptidase
LRSLDCLAGQEEAALPVLALRPDELPAALDRLPAAQAAFARAAGFSASDHELCLLPAESGLAGALFGLGSSPGPMTFGALADKLPAGGTWRLNPGKYNPEEAVLGYCLGAYRFKEFKLPKRNPARLVPPADTEAAQMEARAVWFARDLINRPANLLGPAELAQEAVQLGAAFGADTSVITGAALDEGYPTIAMVGVGADRAPCVARLEWSGSAAPDAPLVVLCGKGVCFDTGGNDIKPAAGMLKMKKDMAGAAILLGAAAAVMHARLPIRLRVLIGCVENSVSGNAMRPLDVVRTRSGHCVEIGNTDAEGRLVLCDLLDEACSAAPALVIDAATLTGAARVALGPDLPALFCNDDVWAERFIDAGRRVGDPIWRLPLWFGYNSWLDSNVADFNNVSTKPFAGAIVAALFLQRFITSGTAWAHFDVYGWNDSGRSGRPEGGEAQCLRAIVALLRTQFAAPAPKISA